MLFASSRRRLRSAKVLIYRRTTHRRGGGGGWSFSRRSVCPSVPKQPPGRKKLLSYIEITNCTHCIDSRNVLEFVRDLGKNQRTRLALGLGGLIQAIFALQRKNDIGQEGTLFWLEGTSLRLLRSLPLSSQLISLRSESRCILFEHGFHGTTNTKVNPADVCMV